jgi:hypothetical protein
MSDLVAVTSFILKQPFVPLTPETLVAQQTIARSGALARANIKL